MNSFDRLGFKTKLSGQFPGVQPNDIKLIVSSGSIKVKAEIITPNATVAAQAVSYLDTSSAADLSAALGVTVTSVSGVGLGMYISVNVVLATFH